MKPTVAAGVVVKRSVSGTYSEDARLLLPTISFQRPTRMFAPFSVLAEMACKVLDMRISCAFRTRLQVNARKIFPQAER